MFCNFNNVIYYFVVKVKQTLTFITGVGCGMLCGCLLGNLGIAKHQGLYAFLQVFTPKVKSPVSLGELNVPVLSSEEKNVVAQT